MDEILKQHQVKNCPKFLEALASIGVNIPKPPSSQGKGKGKWKENNPGKNNTYHPKQEQQPPNKRGRAKEKEHPKQTTGLATNHRRILLSLVLQD